jgi:hypothetical protein
MTGIEMYMVALPGEEPAAVLTSSTLDESAKNVARVWKTSCWGSKRMWPDPSWLIQVV